MRGIKIEHHDTRKLEAPSWGRDGKETKTAGQMAGWADSLYSHACVLPVIHCAQ